MRIALERYPGPAEGKEGFEDKTIAAKPPADAADLPMAH
jgi:hypothetical protein